MTPEERREYLIKVGKPGRSVLDVIDKLRPYVKAMDTELGKTLLEEDIVAHAKLLNTIYESIIDTGNAEQKDAIHLKLLHSRLANIHKKLSAYEESISRVNDSLAAK